MHFKIQTEWNYCCGFSYLVVMCVCLLHIQMYYCICKFAVEFSHAAGSHTLIFVYFVTFTVLKRKWFEQKWKIFVGSVLYIMHEFLQDVF